jgi:hypothetical protein
MAISQVKYRLIASALDPLGEPAREAGVAAATP